MLKSSVYGIHAAIAVSVCKYNHRIRTTVLLGIRVVRLHPLDIAIGKVNSLSKRRSAVTAKLLLVRPLKTRVPGVCGSICFVFVVIHPRQNLRRGVYAAIVEPDRQHLGIGLAERTKGRPGRPVVLNRQSIVVVVHRIYRIAVDEIPKKPVIPKHIVLASRLIVTVPRRLVRRIRRIIVHLGKLHQRKLDITRGIDHLRHRILGKTHPGITVTGTTVPTDVFIAGSIPPRGHIPSLGRKRHTPRRVKKNQNSRLERIGVPCNEKQRQRKHCDTE